MSQYTVQCAVSQQSDRLTGVATFIKHHVIPKGMSVTEAAKRLSAKFPSFTVEQKGDAIVVSSADWEIHLTLTESGTVRDESREMAEAFQH